MTLQVSFGRWKFLLGWSLLGETFVNFLVEKTSLIGVFWKQKITKVSSWLDAQPTDTYELYMRSMSLLGAWVDWPGTPCSQPLKKMVVSIGWWTQSLHRKWLEITISIHFLMVGNGVPGTTSGVLLVLFFWISFFTKNWVGWTPNFTGHLHQQQKMAAQKSNIYEHRAHDFCGVIIVAKRTLKTETEVEETQRHFAGSPLVDQIFTPWYLDVPLEVRING